MTFDHTGLFSTNDLKGLERLAINALEESLPLPSLGGGHLPTTSGCTRRETATASFQRDLVATEAEVLDREMGTGRRRGGRSATGLGGDRRKGSELELIGFGFEVLRRILIFLVLEHLQRGVESTIKAGPVKDHGGECQQAEIDVILCSHGSISCFVQRFNRRTLIQAEQMPTLIRFGLEFWWIARSDADLLAQKQH